VSHEHLLALEPVTTIRTVQPFLARVRAVAAQATSVVVDCAELTHCDTAGLQVVLALRNALAARGGTLRVVNVPPPLEWRFAYAGLLPSAA
jgi:anti-anti-sigma factor